jgi:formiminotetrahydrofolate cyclodeaminase
VAASAERPLAELLSALSERSPAPGAGSAAAWAGALASALLEMTAAYAGADASVARAGALRAQLLESAEQELQSYEPVLAALRLEANDPKRGPQLEEALSRASDAPLAIARAATEVAELAAAVAAQSKPAVAGDAVAGVLLAEAASQTASHLIEINLRNHPRDARLAEVAEVRARAAGARARALGA